MPFWQLHYHLVWTTKGRQEFLTPDVESVIYGYLREKSAELGAQIFALNGTEDHSHVVATVPPKISIANYVGQIKGYSSAMFNKRLDARFRFEWQTEYAAFSFDRKRLPSYIGYVERQKEHHRKDNLIPILERTEPLSRRLVREEQIGYMVESADWRQELIALGQQYGL